MLLHKHIVGLEVLAGEERSRHLLSYCGVHNVMNDRSFHTPHPSLVDECLEGDRLNPTVRVKVQSGAGELVMLREPYMEEPDEHLTVRPCLLGDLVNDTSQCWENVGKLARIFAALRATTAVMTSIKPQDLFDVLCLMDCSREPCHRYDGGASFNYAGGNAL